MLLGIVIALYILSLASKVVLETFLFHFRVKDNPKKWTEIEATDLHPTILFDRVLMALACTFILFHFDAKIFFDWSKILRMSEFLLGLGCVTPFFHDGLLYELRHQLSNKIYDKGFTSNESGTSTALTDKLNLFDTQFKRTVWLFLGVLAITVSQI
jgi:hypothetical protein